MSKVSSFLLNVQAVCVELDTVASLVQENTLQEDEESR